MREAMKEKLREINDLSFYPESHMVKAALGNGVAFGKKHSEEISRLADIADQVEAADLPAGLLEAAHLDSVRLAKGSPVIDQRIGELELRANTGVSIVGIERDGERIVNPGPEETLLEGDRLLLLGEDTKLPKAKAELNG